MSVRGHSFGRGIISCKFSPPLLRIKMGLDTTFIAAKNQAYCKCDRKHMSIHPYAKRNAMSQHISVVLTNFLASISPDAAPEKSRLQDLELCRVQVRKSRDRHGIKRRCKLIVAAADMGHEGTIKALSRALNTDVVYVRTWLSRFVAHGFSALKDAPRSGRPSKHDELAIIERVQKLLETTPNEVTVDDPELQTALNKKKVWTLTLLSKMEQLPYTSLRGILHRNKIVIKPKKRVRRK